MTTPHGTTAEQWSQIEGYAATDLNDDYASCLLDIRARVEALESAQRPAESPAAERVRDLQDRIATGTVTLQDALEELTGLRVTLAPASSLVERVADAIAVTAAADTEDHDLYRPEARAAIRAVAAWLKQEGIEAWAADRLLEEVER